MVSKTRVRRFDIGFKSYQYLGPSPPGPAITGVNYLSGTNTLNHDGPMPNFKRLIELGVDATTHLDGSLWNVEVTRGRVLLDVLRPNQVDHLYYERSGVLTQPSWPVDPTNNDVTNADNMAKSKFISKARQVQSRINGQIFLGELGKTLTMIRRPAQAFRTGLSDYLTTLKKRRRGNAKQRKKVAAGTWLEYSFGWKPLINDMVAGAEALAKSRFQYPALERVTGFGEHVHSSSAVVNVIAEGPLAWDVSTRTVNRTFVIYRGAVYSARSSNGFGKVANNLGFNLDNFVPALWELIPYSFLVDYFTNVGDILSSWSFRDSNIAWRNHTIVNESIQTRTTFRLHPHTPFGKILVHSLTPCESVTKRKTVLRNKGGSLLPTLQFRHPEFGSLKWLNLAALLSQHRRLLPY